MYVCMYVYLHQKKTNSFFPCHIFIHKAIYSKTQQNLQFKEVIQDGFVSKASNFREIFRLNWNKKCLFQPRSIFQFLKHCAKRSVAVTQPGLNTNIFLKSFLNESHSLSCLSGLLFQARFKHVVLEFIQKQCSLLQSGKKLICRNFESDIYCIFCCFYSCLFQSLITVTY